MDLIYDSAHEKALLEAWLVGHKGITYLATYDRGILSTTKFAKAVWASDVARQFTLPNDSAIVIFKDGLWHHRSHLGNTVKHGLGMGSLVQYLDTLGMPKADPVA